MSWSAQLAQSFAVNLQSLTEIAAVNRNMQMHVTGTSFCHLIKGKREENKDRGVYMTKHPFIYGYRKGGLNGISYAHSFWFPNPHSFRREFSDTVNKYVENQTGIKNYISGRGLSDVPLMNNPEVLS